MTQARRLDAAFNMCQWLGVFRPAGQSGAAAAAYTAYRAAFFGLTFAVIASMTVQLFYSSDLVMLARTIDLWTLCWSALYKWTAMVAYSGRFQELHTRLATVHDLAAAAYGGDGPRADRYTEARLRQFGTVSYAYVLSGFLIVGSLSGSTLYSYGKGSKSELEYFNDPKSYPLCCWLPFTVTSYTAFVVLWILILTTLTIAVNIYLIVDTYMFGVIHIMGVHFDLLGESLADIPRTFDNGANMDSSLRELRPINKQQWIKCYSNLSKCVNYHSSILQYLNTIRSIFNTLILFDYLHASISLTFAMFQLTTGIGFGEAFGLSLFILLSLYHQFCNNFFGEYIIQKQLNVRKSAYDFPWIRVDPKSRRLLALMICRTNKPLSITGFYMYKLCFPSFLAFVQSLYSYYMVLRRVNN